MYENSEKSRTDGAFMGKQLEFSAKVRYKQVSSMKLSYFLEKTFICQSYMQVS